jgi:hypothetical protein
VNSCGFGYPEPDGNEDGYRYMLYVPEDGLGEVDGGHDVPHTSYTGCMFATVLLPGFAQVKCHVGLSVASEAYS